MSYRGRVQGGVIVLDSATKLPDGTIVSIEPVAQADELPAERQETLSEVLLAFAGKAQGLPPDASRNHDHYLYGTPKR